ncbi:hypothetical protein FAES_1402 [Fibrella aestuarina BUZ 2]|uniref:Uncharacterized protein n=1 Tax=Fibrella aestuarina BUZ 2 TaxID=1166018 RepID=I0K5K9_9BACT|nr:hypothetical protein [Fibrella aestuarina]CCG99412.1 hypothetical protein FAES_1402 [Fibrella aestuarina BUZ 2]
MKLVVVLTIALWAVGSWVAVGQTRPGALEKGFALVQSRADMDSLHPLKGRSIRAIPFGVGQPLHPIRKYGAVRPVGANAIYIQSSTTLRLYVFPNGLPNAVDLATFDPKPVVPMRTVATVSEGRDLLLDIDFEQRVMTTMKPNRSANRMVNYYSATIGGAAAIWSEWPIDYHVGTKFHYQPCQAPYDINAIKNGAVSGPSQGSSEQRTVLLNRTAYAYPLFDSLGTSLTNSYLRQTRPAYAASGFHLTSSQSPLIIDTDGRLDLENSDRDPVDGEVCNDVGYQYRGVYYQLHFRYARRNLNASGLIDCSPGLSCAAGYRQRLAIPSRTDQLNLRQNTNVTWPQVGQLLIILVPDDGDVAGHPRFSE